MKAKTAAIFEKTPRLFYNAMPMVFRKLRVNRRKKNHHGGRVALKKSPQLS